MPPRRNQSEPIPQLKIPREEARKRLTARLAFAKALRARQFTTADDLRLLRQELQKFGDYNAVLIEQIFSTSYKADRYRNTQSSLSYAPEMVYENLEAELSSLDEHINYLESDINILDILNESPDAASTEKKIPTNVVFIGHGHSSEWLKLEKFLTKTLHLDTEEFDGEPSAGYSVKERLQQMLGKASFAFIVMTGENQRDETAKRYARDSVIHEVGLFQGRLGFEKAIILLEDGCETFSNAQGVVYIPFAKGDLMSASEKIRAVLKREKMIS